MGRLLCPSRHEEKDRASTWEQEAHLLGVESQASSKGPGPLALGSLRRSAVIGQLIVRRGIQGFHQRAPGFS